jgi:hypothetical protein
MKNTRNGKAWIQGTPSILPNLFIHDFSAGNRRLTAKINQAAATSR